MKQIAIAIIFLLVLACRHEDKIEPIKLVTPTYYLGGYYYDSNAYIGSDRGLRSLTITDSTIQGHDYYIKKLPNMSYLVDSTSPIFSFKQESDTIVYIDNVRHYLYLSGFDTTHKSCHLLIGSIDPKNKAFIQMYSLFGPYSSKPN